MEPELSASSLSLVEVLWWGLNMNRRQGTVEEKADGRMPQPILVCEDEDLESGSEHLSPLNPASTAQSG